MAAGHRSGAEFSCFRLPIADFDFVEAAINRKVKIGNDVDLKDEGLRLEFQIPNSRFQIAACKLFRL
jgi:hypothetical protein